MDVRAWLAELGCERYADAFADNDIDEHVLGELSDADLVELGVASLGHRKRLRAAIAKLGVAPAVSLRLAGGTAGGAAGSAAGISLRSSPRAEDTLDPSDVLERELPDELAAELRARGYVLQGHLGRGGMGDVYLARQLSVEREVAIKVLRVRDEAHAAERFAREARAIAALTHPHSVRLFDYVLSRSGACIVMEHVRGQPMNALLAREQRLPFERAAALVMQVCDALAEAHEMGIVHRDLKPANILLQQAEGYRDFVRVLDFGLARWLDAEESRLTRTGTICGTPRYLSPEQIQGSEVTARADLYSLGVILYEALAGQPPFAGDLDAALIFKHLRQAPPSLPDDVARPAELDRLIERLLAKAPLMRPASASALRRELAGLLERPSAPTARPTRDPAASTSTERRHVLALHVALFDEEAFARLDADEAHDLLRRCRAAIDVVRRRYGAFSNAVDASSVQLVLGAPLARRDDVPRALRAALDVKAALEAIAAPSGVVRPRIGVADGLAVAGGLRDGSNEGYFVTGPPLAHARTLSASAAPIRPKGVSKPVGMTGRSTPVVRTGILVSATLAERAAERFSSSPAGDGAHALLGERGAASSSAQTPFVGRDSELMALRRLLDECATPASGARGRVAIVAGEAGIGKSRLLESFEAAAAARGARWAKGLVFDVEVARGEDAMHQIVESLLDLPRYAESRFAALESRVGPDTLRAEQWPFLYHFLGVALPGPMQRLYDAMEPTARQDGYRDMLGTLLLQETIGQPLVVVVEDAHWADGPTIEAIETLAHLARTLPVLLVLSSRVEGEERWSHCLSGHAVTRIELRPLDEAQARELAERLGLEGARNTALIERAGGHPLLLTELAKSGDASGSLPQSIQALVHARLDRLLDADRAALTAASVLGPSFRLAELREVIGDSSYACDRLVDYRFVRRSGDAAFLFAHALVRDAVYASLVDERRRALHERCAECLRERRALSAMHLERAGSAVAASRYLEAARDEADQHRYESARHLARRGLSAAQTGADRVPLLALQGEIDLLLGDSRASFESYRAMSELASTDEERYQAALGRAAALRIASRYEEALAALDDAAAAADRADLPAARLWYLRGGVHFGAGRLQECADAHERALAMAREADDPVVIANALSGLGDAHYGAGRLESAARTWQECIALARVEGLLALEVLNLPMLAMASVFLDRHVHASELAARAVDMAQKLAHRRAETLARGGASLAALVRGEFEEARAQAARALEMTRQLGTVVFEQTAHFYLAQAHLGLGDLDGARAAAQSGLELARAHGMHFVGAALSATLARVTEDGGARRALLEEGEAALGARSLSFNRFWFYENAIEAALDAREPALALRYAEALGGASAEPLALTQRLSERGLALARFAEGARDAETKRALEQALDRARKGSLWPSAYALEAALAAWE